MFWFYHVLFYVDTHSLFRIWPNQRALVLSVNVLVKSTDTAIQNVGALMENNFT